MLKKSKKLQRMQKPTRLTQVTRTLYFFIGIFALSIILFDAGNLLTKESVVDRWMIATILFVANTIAWFLASQVPRFETLTTYSISVILLIFAGYMTYWERGMASSSTLLYVLPMLVVATLKNRHAIIATAALSGATYSLAAVKYFNDFFNEGYRVQLWGNIVLYAGSLLAFSWLLLILADLRRDSK